MLLFDRPIPTPQQNLAIDEALLEACENGAIAGEVLRFWTSPTLFAVLGYTGKVSQEVFVETCRRDGIPMQRRCTGGGTVLQGPGCLNYALLLKVESSSVAGITETNRFVMRHNMRALEKVLGRDVRCQGYTDLTLADKKFSGNAQKRKQKYLLFHGTFLLHFDLPLIAKYLLPPPSQPEYREGREHSDFVTNLNVSEDAIKAAMREEWQADTILEEVPQALVEKLIEEKYSRDEWNLKF